MKSDNEARRLDILQAKADILKVLYEYALREDDTHRLIEILKKTRRIMKLTDEEFLQELRDEHDD